MLLQKKIYQNTDVHVFIFHQIHYFIKNWLENIAFKNRPILGKKAKCPWAYNNKRELMNRNRM